MKEKLKTAVHKELKGGLEGTTNGTGNLLENALKNAQQAELAKVAKRPPDLKLPPRERPDMTPIQILELETDEAEKKDSSIATEVGSWMENTSLPDLDRIESMAKKLGDKIYKLPAGKDEEGEQITFGQQKQEYARLNSEYLGATFLIGDPDDPMSVPALKTRRAANGALLRHRLKKEVSKKDFFLIVDQLVRDGYFLRNDAGKIHVGKFAYFLSTDEKFGELGEDEETLIAQIVGHQMGRLKAAAKKEYEEQAKEMAEDATISFQELLLGKEGLAFAHVPQDKERGLSEVFLLVRGDGNDRVFIEDAVGYDADNALDISERKTFLKLESLVKVPSVKRMTEERRMEDGSVIPPLFGEEDAKRIWRFWTYLHRAEKVLHERESAEKARELTAKAKAKAEERFHKMTEEAETLKEEYQKEATISLSRALLEEPMDGIFYAEFPEEWKNSRGSVPQGFLYFLGEQQVIDGEVYLRVRKAPPHLGKFFAEEDFHFSRAGEQFEGLEGNFHSLMKALARRVRKATE